MSKEDKKSAAFLFPDSAYCTISAIVFFIFSNYFSSPFTLQLTEKSFIFDICFLRVSSLIVVSTDTLVF